MTQISKQQRVLFESLHNSRLEDLKTFQKKDYRGIWSSIIDKYPETAHFVYELLQNADDAGATDVEITVNPTELLFKHNGTKHFDISEDGAEITGDINSITGIGDSSKDELSNKIGKFGVGFKAVFQYTDTPEIYDDTYKFKIENYIVPCLLEYDHPLREEGETLFVFPFKNATKSYKEIIARLEHLEHPILFLRNLIRIKLKIKSGSVYKEYEYAKSLQEHKDYGEGLSMDRYVLYEPSSNSSIFLFSQEIVVTENENKKTNHLISVGFFYDEENQKLITDITQNIFCFFPTKESFKTCFISHAPFLLTDNRQNLKPDEDLNNDLIGLLAKLAANSVVRLRDYGKEKSHLLIDENITEIIPEYSNSRWFFDNYKFEKPIYDAFEEKLKMEALFLSRNGRYLKYYQAYIGSPKELVDLLSIKQFNQLRRASGNLDFLKWELAQSISNSDFELYEKIPTYSSEDLAKDITSSFMDQQEFKWVAKLYTYLRTYASSLWKVLSTSGKQNLPFRSAPIIKTQKGEWVAPYLDVDKPNVFFPVRGQSDNYNFINNEYLENELVLKFFKELELKTPDDYDYIRTAILSKFTGEHFSIKNEDILSDFEFLIGYYYREKDIERAEKLLTTLSEKIYLVSDADDLRRPSSLYLQDERLGKYFGKKELYYVDTEFYKAIIDEYGISKFNEFVCKLGVQKYPQVIINKTDRKFDLADWVRGQINTADFSEYLITDYYLDAFRDSVKKISKEVSLYLWNVVLPAISPSQYRYLNVHYRRKYARNYDDISYCSTFQYELQNYKWIYDEDGKCLSAKQIALENLALDYERNNGLIQYLGIEKKEKSIIELGGTEQQQKELEFGKKIQELNDGIFTEDELCHEVEKIIAQKRAEILHQESTPISHATPILHDTGITTKNTSLSIDSKEGNVEDISSKLNSKWEKKVNEQNRRPHSQLNDSTFEPIDRHQHRSVDSKQPFFDNSSDNSRDNNDNNDVPRTRQSSNLKRKNTEAQENAKEASEQMEILELFEKTEKYTFLWYKLLMELMFADKSKASIRTAQVDFSEWSLECSNKVLRLTNPSKPIPSWLSDAERITVSTLSEHPQKIEGEIVKTDERSVDLSIESPDEIQRACSSAKRLRIIAENSSNIIDSLERRFLQLGYEDDFNLNDGLTKDIKFIYGPPGTGKTTKLVSMIHDIMNERESKINILILTPTNKAADVIAEKLVDDDVCYDYLSRYGATESLYLIEDAAVVMNRDTMDMNLLDSNIVVTTAARYSYDCVQPENTFICDYNWDYIIVDEASMIDIVTITYILHKGIGAKFIIAGDPKQIQPVPQNDMIPLNVYDMVGLNEFSAAINNYTRYPVIALTTQYRSIPSIGDLVSSFAYNGIVKPFSGRAPQKPLALDGIRVNDINFMGFDIVDLDLIKGLNSVGDSAFHLYSVIYTYNLAEYMANQIQKRYPDSDYSIGIVCPYKQQADAIGQMLDNRPVDNSNCHISCGTVHSFQGDECDIMLIVLNPPINCSAGSHINNLNILNVAISRARDYIFFIMPNGQPQGFFQKNRIGKYVNITNRTIADCSKIEEVIFGSDDYISSNTHVTCHMPVNVYKDSNAQYEVRISDDALDIKINK